MQSSIDLVQSNAALVVLHTVSTPGCPATLLPFARLQREKPRMAESKQGGATDVADSDGGWEHPRAPPCKTFKWLPSTDLYYIPK
jgi:hypothetical protein